MLEKYRLTRKKIKGLVQNKLGNRKILDLEDLRARTNGLLMTECSLIGKEEFLVC